jgi:hypothetical protein
MKSLIVGALLSAYSSAGHRSVEYTLYRNSPFGEARVHWATFDADESDPKYNANNCWMAARLLNANLRASAAREGLRPHPGVGFWCEPGRYREQGNIPPAFSSAFPTDVDPGHRVP